MEGKLNGNYMRLIPKLCLKGQNELIGEFRIVWYGLRQGGDIYGDKQDIGGKGSEEGAKNDKEMVQIFDRRCIGWRWALTNERYVR